MKLGKETRQLQAFFLISFLFSWSCWTPGVLAHLGMLRTQVSPTSVWQFLGDFGPAVGALVVAARKQGALGQLGRSMIRWRLPVRWYAATFFIAAFSMAGASAMRAANLHVPFFITLGKTWYQVSNPGLLDWFIAGVGLAASLFFFAAAEEVGWRGFALPRLISSIGVFQGACLLGVLWALWHLPLAFTDGNSLQGESLLLFVAWEILTSLLIAYIWTHTSSGLLTTLFHATGNFTFFLVEPKATTGYRTMTALVLVLGIAYIWKRSVSNTADAKTAAHS